MRALTCIAVDTFASHGLKLNFAPDKSAAFLHLKGKGSKDVRKQALNCDAPVVDVKTSMGVVEFRLGRMCKPFNNMSPEVDIRIHSTQQLVVKLRRNCLSHPEDPQAIKGVIVTSLCMSCLVFNSCVWSTLTHKVMLKVHAFHVWHAEQGGRRSHV